MAPSLARVVDSRLLSWLPFSVPAYYLLKGA